MKKAEFLKKLNDTLEISDSDLTEKTTFNLTSIMNLSLIVFLDENFDLRVKGKDLKEIDSVEKIISLIGVDKFEVK
jgi:acyl carrier protein